MNKHKTMIVESFKGNNFEEGITSRPDLMEKMEEGEQQAQLLKVELKHTIRGFGMILFRIEAVYWLYAMYAFNTACETIVLFAWDLIASILNIVLPIFGADKIKRTSLFACLVIAGYTLIIQDFEIFDVSALYHFFRGQNTVKLYSVGLSIMIFEIMLTTTGRTYLGKLPRIIINSETKPKEILLELILCFLYTIVHFFIIYIDFILFVIILNSSTNSRFLFLFSMSIGKLKTSVFKKFEKKKYKSNLFFDAKDRFHKITFSVIFILTMEERVDTHLYMTILKALAFTSFIDYLQNLTFLSFGGQLN
ncbi:uncharacterized protein LOC116245222 [Nymphaea colorata]|uniref:uncharacterized protein LOC116245222 n=1 Tax=Nymphaea colorata TaxID=210225 RepID=UPI00129E32B1|nr:uncharacterized protein LOC116245222 [Nymphaea colorata]